MPEAGDRIYRAFESYRDVLVRALLRLSVAPADVDDILSESLIRTIEADKKNQIRFLKSYLFTVSRNIVFEQQQRQLRELQCEIDEATLDAKMPPADESLHYRQMMDVFWEAMSQLPKTHQQAILLRRVYGLSQREIAKKMGVSISSVEKYFAQGIKRCHEVMMTHGYALNQRRGAITSSLKGQPKL